MGQNSSSLLERVPSEVLSDILVFAVDPLGPPKAFSTSLSICRQITWRLDRNVAGSRLFRCLFDTSSPERTLPENAMRPRTLFRQLQVYCTTLKAIRRCDIYASDTVDHLWNAYFMLIENDEHNAAQLIQWADVRNFVDRFVRERLHEGRASPKQWPLDTVENSLALWVMWLSMDEKSVTSETSQRRQQLMELVRPYVVNHVRYPVYHVPDNHYNVPIDLTVKRSHFSLQLSLMPPSISLAARLLYFSRSEATPIVPGDGVPENRAAALALNQDWVRPTLVDLREFNAQHAARPPMLAPPDAGTLLSLQHDNCLHRLMYCRSPFSLSTLAPYTLGSLTGDFAGRMLIPDATQNTTMLNQEDFIEGSPSMAIAPFYGRFAEWQCVNPQKPVPEGGEGSRLWDEGVRNGWFPEVIFRIEGDVLRIAHRFTGGVMYCYERYVPGQPNSHNPATCTACQARRAMEERVEEERIRAIIEYGGVPPPPRDARTPTPGSGGDEDMAGSSVDDQSGKDASVPPSAVPDTLPRPQNPLDPSRIVREIQGGMDGEDVERILDHEMEDATSAALEDEDMVTDTESEVDDAEDDGYSPFDNDSCAGVRDIIITGETIQRHAEAWHAYVFYGRVRKFDGLVALVRKPVSFPDLGVQIFRGYVVGGTTLVGNWRAFRPNPAELSQEGPFIASRTDFGA